MRSAILATAGLLISLDVVATINIAAMHSQRAHASKLIDTRPKDSQEFFICWRTRIVAAYNVCKFKKNQTWGKSYEVLNFFAWGFMDKKG